MRQLTSDEISSLVTAVEHLSACEDDFGGCASCRDLLATAKAGIDRARQEQTRHQAMMVEATLGGDKRGKKFKCIGCETAKTILRCKLCRLPVCLRCLKTGALHAHTVRVRSDIKLTTDITDYDFWDKNGNKIPTEVRHVPVKRHGYNTTEPRYVYKGTEREVKEKRESRVVGQRQIRWKRGKYLNAGDTYIMTSDEFDPKYFELVD